MTTQLERRVLLVGICLFAVAAVVGCGAQYAGPAQSDGDSAVRTEGTLTPTPGRSIVLFVAGARPEARRAAVAAAGGQALLDLDLVNGLAAQLPEAAAQKLERRADVVAVVPDYLREVNAKPAGVGGGKPGNGGGTLPPQTLEWNIDHIDAEVAQANGISGLGVKLAIIDTGLAKGNADLAVAGGYNATGAGKPTDWVDKYGHGTHVAGIAAAADNATGVVGVAPGASLYALRVMDRGGFIYDSYIVNALGWCVSNGIDVANMSLGGPQYSSALKDACDSAAANGIVLVASSGNGGSANNIGYPAAFDSVIAVGATDASDQLALFSDYGPQQELVAPGVNIRSDCTGSLDGSIYDGDGAVNGFAILSGTSMSAPHVAGAAALALQAGYPDARAILQSTAVDLGDSGRDDLYGFGLVDAQGAAGVP